MRSLITIFCCAVILFSFYLQTYSQCPEAPSDNGICDTVYVEPWEDDFAQYHPGGGPYLFRVPLFITHDVPNPAIDSIAAMVIPLCFTRTNPTKYCSVSSYWNRILWTGSSLPRSIFRHLVTSTGDTIHNWMMDLYNAGNGEEWSTIILDFTTEPRNHFWLSMVPTASEDPKFGPGSKVLIATMTLKLQDSMEICIDTCLWPPTSQIAFARCDAQTYIPRSGTGNQSSFETCFYFPWSEPRPPNHFSLISPVNNDTITNLVTLSWRKAFDPDPNDTVRYSLYLSRSVVFNPDSTLVFSTLLDTTYTDSLDLGFWYWKVKAYDTGGLSRWSNQSWCFFVFVPLDSFSLISPQNGAFVINPILLSWQTSTEPVSNDTIRYDLYISRSAMFSPESTLIYSNLLDTSYVCTPNSGLWYWKVKAHDLWGLAIWSNEIWSYWVCSEPDPYSLLSPLNNDSVRAPVTLAWQESTDPDPNDTVRYDLYLSHSSSFDSSIIVDSLIDASFTDSLAGGLWYWKTKAWDTWGLTQWSNQTDWSFYVLSGPESFSLISPTDLDSVKTPLTLC